MSNYKTTPVGRFHVIIKSEPDPISGECQPLLCINVNGQPVLLDSLFDFFKDNSVRGYEWMRIRARAVGLFYDFKTQHAKVYDKDVTPLDLMKSFGRALVIGTVSPKSLDDPLDLYWPSTGVRTAKKLMSALKEFVDWCAMNGIVGKEDVHKITIRSTAEKGYLKHLYAANNIQMKSFFAHTINVSSLATKLRRQQEEALLQTDNSTTPTAITAKYFPSWLVPDLFTNGFITGETEHGEEENITAKFITVLLMFGGIRISEAFHIWFNDVIPQVNSGCKVILRHPSDSQVNIPGEPNLLRKQYLAMRGLFPRNTRGVSKTYYSGWKNLAVDASLEAPVFFLHDSAENLVRSMYFKYLKYREKAMVVYRSIHGFEHPFLFVSSQGKFAGQPYSMGAYRGALKSAYDRLEHKFGYTIPRAKKNGTTPHGMRRFYGQSLTDSCVEPKIIQKALRHRSVLSQIVYTEPKDALVEKTLNEAKIKIGVNKDMTLTSNIIGALNG